jgi:hypothetical protein
MVHEQHPDFASARSRHFGAAIEAYLARASGAPYAGGI